MHHKKTRNYSQLNIEKLQFACSNIVPKNYPMKWAFNARSMGNEYPTLGLSIPVTGSLSARHTGTKRPTYVLIPNYSCLCFPSYS